MTEKPLETIGDVNAALKHLGWQNVDDLHYWAQGNDIERFEQLVQAFATHRAEAVAALEADNAAHVRNTLDGYKVADELAAERDALEARVRELEAKVVEQAEELLWFAYDTGFAHNGRWTHNFMSDGERLARQCSFDPRLPDYDDAEIRAAIPIAARKALHDPRKG